MLIIDDNEIVPTFSRDCFEVQIDIPNKILLYKMFNHFKSMGYSPKNDPLSNRRWKGQAERVEQLVDQHDLEREYLAITGDLNADANTPSLHPLLNKKGLYNVNLELDPFKRGTYRTGKKQFDYIIISDALKAKLKKVHIERKGVYSTKWKH